MFAKFNQDFKKELLLLKRKYRLLKLKAFLLFILPVFIFALAAKVSKEFLKIKLQKMGMES